MNLSTSAGGTTVPLVICVSGLTECELPGAEFLAVKLPGLCIGAGANVGIRQFGHILFMRNSDGAKQKKFAWYQQTILVSHGS